MFTFLDLGDNYMNVCLVIIHCAVHLYVVYCSV